MLNIGSYAYSPVLRLKQGEYTALGQVSVDILAQLLPLFVVPPPKERDPELQRALTSAELIVIPGKRLGRHWPLRPCLLDPRYLFRKLGSRPASEWLPTLLRVAIAADARPTLVSDLRTVEGKCCEAIQTTVHDITHSFALRITLDELSRSDLQERIHSALLKLVLKPQECFLIMDFGKAEMSDPEAVGDILLAEFQKVMDIGLWGQVIWHGTSYPEKNPASSGRLIELPRNEWLAWSRANSLDTELRKNLMYGDFAADSAKFNFASGGIAPIPHYRYSTPKKWIVVRASDGADTKTAMKEVATKIVGSVHFAGRSFSSGDKYIADTATDKDGPGSAMTWRRVNTIHHLTRVVTDLAPGGGYKLIERMDVPEPEQADLPFQLSSDLASGDEGDIRAAQTSKDERA